MPLDPGYTGKTYPPAPPYLVGREKIRDFAVAIGADDPVYLDPEAARAAGPPPDRSEEHTSELQSLRHLVCRLLLEKKKKNNYPTYFVPQMRIYALCHSE